MPSRRCTIQFYDVTRTTPCVATNRHVGGAPAGLGFSRTDVPRSRQGFVDKRECVRAEDRKDVAKLASCIESR
jgi:hypothetical protein